jgi:hypothetical protein
MIHLISSFLSCTSEVIVSFLFCLHDPHIFVLRFFDILITYNAVLLCLVLKRVISISCFRTTQTL